MKSLQKMILGRIITLLFLVYASIVFIGCATQRNFVWPMSAEEPVDRPVPLGAECIWIESQTGSRVEGWLFKTPLASKEKPKPAIIFFHGNNEVMDHCLEYAETYPSKGFSFLLVEYRGYGRSTGIPDRENIRKDMMRFYDELISRDFVDASKIIFHGRSIGGAVAADLSRHRKPAAMILVATFTSMESMFWRYGIPGFIASDKYRTFDILKTSDFPILVMHGKRDNIIPVSNGRKLGTSTDKTRYIEYDANHDLPTNWEVFEQDLTDFLAVVFGNFEG